MSSLSLLVLGSILAYATDAFALPSLDIDVSEAMSACKLIQRGLSQASEVFFPGSLSYIEDNSHYLASSSQVSVCSVEPGSADDVSTILRILGTTRTPFGVKGGGHSFNPEFSSSSGVQISMTRFDSINYDSATGTATIGAGVIWDDVYAALLPFGVIVPGGRVSGIGVAGFTLGGGYTWKTNQIGLAIDSVLAFELVKPDGEIMTVDNESDPDLFFSLKGGLNNFGIVTQFTFQTVPQDLVWGGSAIYSGEAFTSAIVEAGDRFTNTVTDPKAEMILTFVVVGTKKLVNLLLFYDAPTPAPGIFDDFLSVPTFIKDMKTRDFLSLIKSLPNGASNGESRGITGTIATTGYNSVLVEAIQSEANYWSREFIDNSVLVVSYSLEPFLHAPFLTGNRLPSAYPPPDFASPCPLIVMFTWKLPMFDEVFHAGVRESVKRLTLVAEQQGLLGSPVGLPALYPNYATIGTPLEEMYAGNVDKLREVRSRVDPDKVMDLTGGLKF